MKPLEPEFDPGLPRRRSEHGGMPRRDDDEFALAAERGLPPLVLMLQAVV
jgi:hypothetical protein